MFKKIFWNWKGDLFGGMSSSIIALPLALAFGIVAFAPLGPTYASMGALTCLYGAIFTSFFASLFGGTPTQITGPTGPMSVMIASMIAAQLQMKHLTPSSSPEEIQTILTLVFFAVLLGGLVQVLIGLSGGGKLIKYIPYPVIAGFMNGVALIIFLSQVKPFLGLRSDQSVFDLFSGGATPSWISVTVGFSTVLAVVLGPKLLKNVPGALLGLVVGMATYFVIGFLGRPELLQVEGNSFIIGNLPAKLPLPTMGQRFLGLIPEMDRSVWLSLLAPAFTLGLLGAIDSLLTSLVADVVTKTRHKSNQELIGQGLGNMIASVFGGLPGAGSTVRTLANIQNGGRTRLSGMICGLTVFVIVMLFANYARYIPYAVLAGILMVTASKMVDTWSFQLVKRKSTWREMGIVVLVAAVTVLVSLMVAVGLGVLITMILFIRDQVTRSVIKGKFTGAQVRSKKVRTAEELLFLDREGHRILVYQLDGSLFFGTADGLMKDIEKESQQRDFILLDFRLVRDIDLTGIQILRQVNDLLTDSGKILLISYVVPTRDYSLNRVAAFLTDIGIVREIGEDRFFPDTDLALEWAENRLLEQEGALSQKEKRRIDLRKMKTFQYLSNGEMERVANILGFHRYRPNEVIFREGDTGDTMYFISKGTVSIYFNLKEGAHKKRIASFGEGIFFGEMALLEEKPRSATAVADEETELYSLTRADFLRLLDEEPKIASKIQLGIARELSARLRTTSEELKALEL